MGLQELWLQTGTLFFVAASCAVALAVARRRIIAPLVIFGTLFLVMRALGFLLAYLASEEGAPPSVQVLTHYARIAPSVLLLIYACLILARRYRAARSNDLLRAWFRRAAYVHGGAVLANLVADLVVRPPLLEGSERISAFSFYASLPNYATAVAYALAGAFVFVGAAKTGEGALGAGQRLQNLSWGVSLAGLGVLTSFALARQGVRAFAPEGQVPELVESLSSYEPVFYAAYAGGITLGIFSYYAQSRRDRFVERFLGFLDLVGDLTEELANAPISRERLNVPYAAMGEAAGEEFLGLSPEDKRKLDGAFRLGVVWEHRAGLGPARVDRSRMADLLEAYEYELEEPVLARGLEMERGQDRLPEALRDLFPNGISGKRSAHKPRGLGESLALVLKKDDELEKSGLEALPEWEQLAFVALADAGLLPERSAAAILGAEAVSEKALDAYRLARYKLRTYCR